MKNKTIKGYKTVAVLITNKKRNSFIFQKKDREYWISQLRFKYCFFGGEIEKGEDEKSALERELSEELEQDIARIIYEKSKKIFSDNLIDILGRNCALTLYESILPNRTLKKIISTPIKEGEASVLVKREDIPRVPFFPDLKGVLEKYLNL